MIRVFVIREVRLTLGGKWNSISLGSRARATHSFRRMASSSWFENLRAGPGSKWRLRLPNLYRVAAMPAVNMPPVTRSKGFHVLSSILSLTFINLAHVRAAIACGWKLGLPPSSNSSRLNISTSVRCADCSVRDLWEGFCARDDEDAIFASLSLHQREYVIAWLTWTLSQTTLHLHRLPSCRDSHACLTTSYQDDVLYIVSTFD